MRAAELDLTIAMLSRPDFGRARKIVAGFDRWADFDDYQNDRDGLFIGLVVAGANVRMAPVAIDHFLDWLRARGQAPTFARLEEFAALISALRSRPGPTSHRGLLTSADARAGDRHGLTIPVAASSYEDWLLCLGRAPEPSLLDAYASFLVEAWTDLPDPAVIAFVPQDLT